MLVLRQDTGRKLQKRRTRLAIIEAASRLLAEGRQPTVAEAADAALVSRATAYRYFPSQRALLIEVAVQAAHRDLPPALKEAPGDAATRWDIVCREIFDMVLASEVLMRTMLQVTQEEWLANRESGLDLRQGRRLEWIEAALKPLRVRLEPAQFDRLLNALAALVGIEPYVALRDVCKLDSDAALTTLQWAGRALIHSSTCPAPHCRGDG
jgi:AcrR family transcriptional regulator